MTDSEPPQTPDDQDLLQKRKLINQLLTSEGKEGDYWNLIPNQFLQDFLNLDVNGFDDLTQRLGPINTQILLDENGMLYMEEEADKSSVCVHPSVFESLVEWFGLEGPPISRALIIDETGNRMVERFPPYFFIHTLNKTSKLHQRPQGLMVSSILTFQNLIDSIKSSFFKNVKADIRLWFLQGKVDGLPSVLTIHDFINLDGKSVVLKGILNDKLKDQLVNQLTYHILVEVLDKNLVFPVDQYISNFNDEVLDLTTTLSTGGDSGLANLGNTCYMNSALQCLVHIPEVNYYFFFNVFLKELNKSNPLGYNGNMAQAFGSLLHKLFDNGYNYSNSISPKEFKYTIGHFSSMFQGYQQQDSQEFLSWLLDALHEDLNRIYDKPYLEKPELKDEEVNDLTAIKRLADISWDQYKKRNDSVIVDLFSGLYQSVLVCPDCGKTSITYDPFNDLTLPLPIDKKWYHTFTIVNLDFSQDIANRLMRFEVELNKTSTFEELLSYMTDFLKVPKEYLFLYELYNDYFYQDFQSNNKKYKFIPISEIISSSDNIIVYIIPHTEEDMIIPVFNVVSDPDKSYNITNGFGLPLFINVDADDCKSFGKIRRKLEQVNQILTKTDINAHYDLIRSSSKQFYNKADFEIESNPDDDEGYDSDVSLADPKISGDYGFTIKVYQDDRFRNDNQRKIKLPYAKPNFTNLEKLAVKLPDLKYNYYHYPNYVKDKEYVMVNEEEPQESGNESELAAAIENEMEEDVEVSHIEEALKTDDADPEEPNVSSTDEMDSDNSDSERLGGLFDSVHTLPQPPNVDSPIKVDKDNHPLFLKPNTLLVCDWDHDIHDQLFGDNKTWENLEQIANPELDANKAKLLAKQKSTISLYDCLDKFYQPEILGDQDLWYCPKCQDHKQATKTIKIWDTGDILTIHLKRFQMARSFSDKIDVTVDFPIEGLDMSPYVNNDGEELIYDLIAVDNHYGGLGGGHYTASALNFRDQKWYYYNDSRVTRIEDPRETISGAAYLLFYRKRSKQFVGGDALKDMIEAGQVEFEESLKQSKQKYEALQQQVGLYLKEAQQQAEKEAQAQAQAQETQLEEESQDMEIESLSSGKKSRSPLIDEGEFDNKKRMLDKDKVSTSDSE